MNKSIKFFTLIALIILIVGLGYNLFNANKEIDNSFYIDKQLNNIRAYDQDLTLLTENMDTLNYDQVQKKIIQIDTLFNSIHHDFHDEKIDKLKVSFNQKKEIVGELKSTNSIFFNAYKNTLKLRDFVVQSLKLKKHHDIVDFVVDPIASFLQTKKTSSAVAFYNLKQLFQSSYSDSKPMELLIVNIEVFNRYLKKIKILKNQNKEIGFNKKIYEIITHHEEYSKKNIRDVQFVVGIFIVLLVLFLIVMYVLSNKLNEKVRDIEKLNENFDTHIISSRSDLFGSITYASKAFCEISGYSKEELIGNGHNMIRHPDMSSKTFKDVWDTLHKDKTWSGDIKNLKKDGSYYWVHSIISPLFTSQGTKVGYSSIRQDITDAKKIVELNKSLEDKVNKAIEEALRKDILLQQQARLAQMGEMLSMIAHQWRQPISAINNILNDLEFEIELDELESVPAEQLVQYSQKIKEFTAHLSNTIDDFRNFYNPNKKSIIELVSVPIRKALGVIEKSCESDGIEITEEYSSNVVIEMYDSELMQVILNMLKNAQDNFQDSSVDKPCLSIKTFDKDDASVIEICDNGGGIPDDILPKIFDPYFSTKSEKNGTGLGLYMSQTIIKKHKEGRLSVENRNGGACFIIELPHHKSV